MVPPSKDSFNNFELKFLQAGKTKAEDKVNYLSKATPKKGNEKPFQVNFN